MASPAASSSLKEPIDLAEYLFARLRQAGVKSVHGVPGDYNLVALDYVPKAGMTWVGNCNELNAGYAADGYGKINGLAAIITTFGVGELSAINALAGAYSEFSPVVHVVGCPSTAAQRDGMLLHHTLGNGDFRVFRDMAARVSEFVAELDEARTAAQLVDEAVVRCWVRSRPVYVWLPTDMVRCKVEGERLKTPLKLEYPPNDKEKEDYVTEVVLKHLRASKSAIVLVDACAIRHRVLHEVKEFLAISGLPVVTSPMGKGAINEQSANYCGIYAGSVTRPDLKERVESADLVLTIGSVKSDFNTAGFTYRISQLATIDLHSTMVKVKYSEFPGVQMHGVLHQLAARIRAEKLPHVTPGPHPPKLVPARDASPTITHAWMWPQLGAWLRPDDVVVTETGTANFGVLDTRFPAGVRAVNQYLWGSIGYATPAAQGAALAVRDGEGRHHYGGGGHADKGRTVLWTGDGSLQLVAQSVSTMLRNGLAPVIFVICNGGYTIERFIHGMDAAYNDVADWRYGELPAVFGAAEGKSKAYVVKTKEEFEGLLADREFSDPESGVLRFVEVYMERDDAPFAMKATSVAAAKGVGG